MMQVGVFPNEESLLRLVGSILMGINEEWVTRKVFDHAEGMIRQRDRAQANYRRSETLLIKIFLEIRKLKLYPTTLL
ncbi:MAG TPA: hypothetical protein DDX29_05560 [Clostridiales bacterium]|nr:hypothetical protein [Clostridiales bacterium]